MFTNFEYYSRHAKGYHAETFAIDPTPFLEPLTRFVKPPAKILDVGCASGRDLLWFKKKGYAVLGLERVPAFAQMARKNADCEVIEADFQSFDFKALSVDAAVLIGALVHLEKRGFIDALKRISQSVKRTGFLLLSIKAGSGCESRGDGRIFYLWNDAEVRAVFDGLGLDVKHYSQTVSQLGTGEKWLAYVLQKNWGE